MAAQKMHWFKVGCDITRNPAVRRLTPDQQYLYVVAMHAVAMRSPTPGVLLDPVTGQAVTADELADEAGPAYTADAVTEGIGRMRGLVDQVEVRVGDDVELAWRLVDWEASQFVGLSPSTPRVRRHRAKKKAEANGQRELPADPTPPEARTDVERLAEAARVIGARNAARAATKPGKVIDDPDGYRARCIENLYTDHVLAQIVADHPDADVAQLVDLFDAQTSAPALTLVPVAGPAVHVADDDPNLLDTLERSLVHVQELKAARTAAAATEQS